MADDRKDIDELSGIETTGHEWDGLKELNNPLPKWWVYTFYASCVWALLYTVLFPAWPLVNQATAGIFGYSSREAVMQDIAEHKADQSLYVDRIAMLDVDEIAADPELAEFAMNGGAAVFRTHCSQCHGAGAEGRQLLGYPNLNDDAWLWGGQRAEIYQTIAHGIRWEEDYDTRYSEMPAFGSDDILSAEEIRQVVEFVWTISHTGEPEAVDWDLAVPGADIYDAQCASCHGVQGLGNHDLGAPNLADSIWLYGGDRETLYETVYNARNGVMPAWLGRLTEAEIKQVSLWVHGRGGGEETGAEPK